MLDSTTQNKIERLVSLYKIYNKLDDEYLRSHVSDIMRFDTPLVWIGYKANAYCGTGHAINTVADLRAHCNDPEDICGKRFDFVACIINAVDNQNPISILWEDQNVFAMLSSQDLINDWMRYEFYEVDGRICKWESYRGTLGSL
jgi:hypothetical protein